MSSQNHKIDDSKEAQSALRQQLETAAVVCSWFALNITIASSTKWIFEYGTICIEDKGCTQYKFPVAITVIHMIFSWMLCRFYLFQWRGGLAGKTLSLVQQVREIMPLSLCFALSVAMGNLSLKYIYPSFNQMLGSMSPLITVLLAVLLQRKQFSLTTWLSMPVICAGLAVCSLKELNFNALGAFYASGATVLRAVKSLIQGRLLTQSHKMDSVTLLYYMAPWAAMWLTILMLILEGGAPLFLLLTGLHPVLGTENRDVAGAGQVLILLMFSGLNACLLNIANFLVTSYTSPVTLQVLGNVKSCLSIAVSVAIFRNSLTVEQAFGVVTCLLGVWLYNRKSSSTPRATKAEESKTTESTELPRIGRS